MKLKFYLLYLTLFLLIEALQFLFHQQLFNKSLSIIERLQSTPSLSTYETLFHLFYFLTFYGWIVIATTFFSFSSAVYLCFVFFIEMIFEFYIKIMHMYPRPFYVSDKVKGLECSIQFGYPSGHLMISASQAFTLCLIIHKELEASENRRVIEWIFFPLIFLMLALTAYSRMMLGMHSLDQVLFGALLGILLSSFLYQLCFHRFNSEMMQSLSKNRKQILIFFIPQLIMLLTYVIGNEIYKQPQIWTQRIHKTCPHSNASILGGMLQANGLGYIWLGALLGLYIDSKLVQSNVNMQRWNKTQFWCRGFARLAISLIGAAILDFILMGTPGFHQMWLQYIFKISLLAFLVGLYEIGFVRAITQSCKLIKKESQLYAADDEEEQIEILQNKM